ncbi:MAG: hypothetical protein NT013_21425, partial [Planctomycetia bacterium]|nr:hypothetical protein [Planctomycetia bacterium]
AEDLVQHFERRLEAMDGKAMVVCMSRRICVDLYNELIKLRPDWASVPDDDIEAEKKQSTIVKIVMTGSADDGADWQPHIRSKLRRKALATRFKDTKDPFRIVIVRDMWLTGFDAPCLHTMYADKPMRGHGLMQAIARVNRVFRDKQGGLIVDYLGLADQLKQALVTYTESGGQGSPIIDTAQAVAVLLATIEDSSSRDFEISRILGARIRMLGSTPVMRFAPIDCVLRSAAFLKSRASGCRQLAVFH